MDGNITQVKLIAAITTRCIITQQFRVFFCHIMDIIHEQSSNGSEESTPDILLARHVPFKEMKEKWETFSIKQLLEMGLNCVHEATHSLYINHVYNGVVADTFLGDDLFGTDITIPNEERMNNVVKRVQKITATSKVAMGQSGRGGRTSRRREGCRRRGSNNNYNVDMQLQYNTHNNYNYDYMPNEPPVFGRFNGHGSNNFGGNNGGDRGNGGGTCFICGSTGHHAKQCPKAG
jgi:hypothetical protein